MHCFFRIEIWVQVGAGQIFLGEVASENPADILQRWRQAGIYDALTATKADKSQYMLMMYDGANQQIGSKHVATKAAERLLGIQHWLSGPIPQGQRSTEAFNSLNLVC